jgi:hypothetical protein
MVVFGFTICDAPSPELMWRRLGNESAVINYIVVGGVNGKLF